MFIKCQKDGCYLYKAHLKDPVRCACRLCTCVPLDGEKIPVLGKFPSDFLPFSTPFPFWERVSMLELFHWEAAASVVWLLVLPSSFPELQRQRWSMCVPALPPHQLNNEQQNRSVSLVMVFCQGSFGARVDKMGMRCSVHVCNSEIHPAYFRFDIIYQIGTSEELAFQRKDYLLHLKNFRSSMKGSSFSIILLLETRNIRQRCRIFFVADLGLFTERKKKKRRKKMVRAGLCAAHSSALTVAGFMIKLRC